MNLLVCMEMQNLLACSYLIENEDLFVAEKEISG